MTKRNVALLTLLALLLGFGWGFSSHRSEFFPFDPLHELLGAPKGKRSAARERVDSRSPRFEALALAALGYVEGSVDADAEVGGVLEADAGRTSPGLNLYNSRRERSARLIDVEGRTVFEWSSDTARTWQSVHLLSGGRLLVIGKDRELILLDRDSQPLWHFEGRIHHDLDVVDDEIYVLNRRVEARPEIHAEHETLVDFVSVLSLDGEEQRRIEVLDLLQASPYAYLLPSLGSDFATDAALDVLHTNEVQVLDGHLAGRSKVFAKGNLLLSARNINAVFIVDPNARKIVWLWGPGNLTFQHHPQLLANGNLLLFDNGLEASRVLELDPLRREIVWSYEVDGFFSRTRGSAQRLHNGNTLITESDTGYVFEVDPSGERVWLFANPDVDSDGLRSAIWRMTRYPAAALDFLVSAAAR